MVTHSRLGNLTAAGAGDCRSAAVYEYELACFGFCFVNFNGRLSLDVHFGQGEVRWKRSASVKWLSRLSICYKRIRNDELCLPQIPNHTGLQNI